MERYTNTYLKATRNVYMYEDLCWFYKNLFVFNWLYGNKIASNKTSYLKILKICNDWVRSIPEKIIRPYEAIVYERKKNVQTMHNELNEKLSSRFNKFRKDMGDTPNSKKNIIRVVVKIVAFVVLFVVITILMAKSIKQEDWAINKIVNWHDNLESDRKLLVNKIYACVVMVGLMVIVILRGVKIYSFKTSRFEKIKFVIELIILEFVMGCGLAMILSQ